jgi:PHS family inorganic phosphate transporter-like MFS transporter
LVALIAVAGFQHHIPTDPDTTTCTGNCIRSLDTIWRLLVGLGAVPAFIALWFRLTIIESPRYTAEVTKDSLQAVNDVSQFYQRVSIDSASVNSVEPPSPESGSFQLSPTQSAEQQPDRPASAAPFAEQDATSPLAIWKDFKLFLRQKDNFRKLAATSLCWFCLDLPFYGLGLISPRITRTIWFGSKLPRTGLYQLLFQTAYQSIVVVSSGAIVGNLLSILTIDKLGRRNIQLNGFFWLFLLNVVIGASFQHLVKHDDPSALVVLYILCQIFFNFGEYILHHVPDLANSLPRPQHHNIYGKFPSPQFRKTADRQLPAELFPTRFRCTCHGIAAAFGKLGSILAQCFLAYVDFGNGADYTNVPDWLGYALLW